MKSLKRQGGWAGWASLAGAAIGAIGGSQGGSTQTAQTQDPWSGVQSYLRDLFSRGQGLLGQPGIGPQSPYTMSAIQQQAQLAQDPNSLVAQAQKGLGQTIAGDYLDPSKNPYLASTAQQAIDQATRSVSGRFSGENYGSAANREWMTRSATEAASPYYFGAYNQERQNQLNAMQLAPGLQFANIPQLYQAGQMQEARGQAELDAPWTQLARYRGLLTGTPGGTTTTNQPYFTNPWASALGGAAAGASIYNSWPSSGSSSSSMFAPGNDYGFGYN